MMMVVVGKFCVWFLYIYAMMFTKMCESYVSKTPQLTSGIFNVMIKHACLKIGFGLKFSIQALAPFSSHGSS